ncbi:MAG: hypothetical protein M3Z05_11305 [Gemmatimonadota bacterium]|nr:hypothetical protein [Gemmatimonadota bacterium]
MFDPILIPIIFVSSIPVIAIGVPLARAFAKRIGASPSTAALPHELTSRLERMEQAIDAIAVEMERVSEGQRFTTKLLSERAAEKPAVRAGGEPG